jgi:hypothetical protein
MAIKSETYTLKPDDIPFVTNGISQPSYYADIIRGSIMTGEVIKLNFVEMKMDVQSGGVVAAHVCTIIAPKSQLRAWANYLNQVADENNLPPLPALVSGSPATEPNA